MSYAPNEIEILVSVDDACDFVLPDPGPFNVLNSNRDIVAGLLIYVHGSLRDDTIIESCEGKAVALQMLVRSRTIMEAEKPATRERKFTEICVSLELLLLR